MTKQPQRTTIKDIARDLGLSFSTVSRILRGSELFNAQTVEKVYRKAEELNYSPNILARGLVRKGSSLIGLVLRDVEQSFFATIIDAVQTELEEKGYSIILCNSKQDPAKEKKHLVTLVDKFVEGIIITPITNERINAASYNKVIHHPVPLIMVGNPKMDVEANYVKVDNTAGAELAVQHLIELGHRSVAYLTFNRDELDHHKRNFNNENIERYQGYLQVVKSHGMEPVVALTDDADSTERTIQELLSAKPRPTAIFAYSDLLACNLIRSLEARGYHVPQDFSVVGFDDLEYARMFRPALTTLAQPKKDLGRLSAQNLIEMIKGHEVTDLILQPQLVIRETSAPPPKSK